MIDWQKVARQNGLTPEEFTKEILKVAAAVGEIELERTKSELLRFTASDDKSTVQILIKRID